MFEVLGLWLPVHNRNGAYLLRLRLVFISTFSAKRIKTGDILFFMPLISIPLIWFEVHEFWIQANLWMIHAFAALCKCSVCFSLPTFMQSEKLMTGPRLAVTTLSVWVAFRRITSPVRTRLSVTLLFRFNRCLEFFFSRAWPFICLPNRFNK